MDKFEIGIQLTFLGTVLVVVGLAGYYSLKLGMAVVLAIS